MTKRTLLTLLVALVGLTASWATSYSLYVAGVQVTSSNCSSLKSAVPALKSGDITYDDASRTLTLDNAMLNVTTNVEGIKLTGIDDFTIRLKGDNTITSTSTSRPGISLAASKNITITGTGSLDIECECFDILYCNPPASERVITLTGGCTVNLLGEGLDDDGDYNGKLIVNGASLYAKYDKNFNGPLRIQELEVRNANIVQPADASQYTWINQSFKKDGGNGDEYKGDIEIRMSIEQEAQSDNPLNVSRYDVDGNGLLTIVDVTQLVNALLGHVNYPVTSLALTPSSVSLLKGSEVSLTANVQPAKADYRGLLWKTSNCLVATVDASGKVVGQGTGMCTITAQTLDGSSISASCNVTVVDPSGTAEDYVDLGLPSGTLWATCNLGATKPEEFGDYYAWGETEPYATGGKTEFSWSTYKYCRGSETTLTKYCMDSKYGTVDNQKELLITDDAANTVKGGYWRIPTGEQCMELFDDRYTTQTWTTLNGVNGLLVTSIVEGYAGNSIFLPAAGCHDNVWLTSEGSDGVYWARTLDYSSKFASGLFFSSSYTRTSYYYTNSGCRYSGNTIRPVWKQ